MKHVRQSNSSDDPSLPAAGMLSEGSLKEKIKQRAATVAVIGLGYVGLPLCISAAEAGFRVVGYDSDEKRVFRLNSGDSYVGDVTAEQLTAHLSSGNLVPASDPDVIAGADVIVICVPTPLNRNQVPDLSFIRQAARLVAAHLKPETLVVLESTTYPGCTREEVRPLLEKTGLRAGKDFWLAFSPERIDPGSGRDPAAIPKLVGGISRGCTEMATLFYSQFLAQIVALSSSETAEMAKLLENIYRSVNIALVNELAVICNRMGISVWEVVDAAATKPYGFTPFYPGPGLGGHCIPIDPFYLSWKARELGLPTEFIELAGRINTRMPEYVVERISAALNSRQKCLRGARILLVGAAYKEGVSDLRGSPSIRVAELLMRSGAEVGYHDPYVAALTVSGKTFASKPLDEQMLAGSDCVVALTAHSCIDWDMVARLAPLVLDTRNIVPRDGAEIFSI
ncbi:MAG: nucleotide sugar dehydrogenase [Thermoleophilia bacterium]